MNEVLLLCLCITAHSVCLNGEIAHRFCCGGIVASISQTQLINDVLLHPTTFQTPINQNAHLLLAWTPNITAIHTLLLHSAGGMQVTHVVMRNLYLTL